MHKNVIEKIEKYKEHLILDELAEGTIDIYVKDAVDFEKFLSGRDISKHLVLEYKDKLIATGNKASTINRHIIAVNHYLKYSNNNEIKLKTLRIQKRHSLDSLITIEEYKRLLSYAKESGKDKYYYIMRTMAMTGIRVSEIQYFTTDVLDKKSDCDKW